MWIKICANTSVEDAQAAIDLGADAVGFVFAPSSRRVTSEEVRGITARLVGGAERVGVFQTDEFDVIRDAVGVAGLSGVQLHRGYSRELPRRLRKEFGDAVTIAQTLHWGVEAAGSQGEVVVGGLLEQVREIGGDGFVDRVLVDSKVGEALGGTGQVFDWDAAMPLFAEAVGARMILAGGLNAKNVGEAIGRLRPWGVDVASGVEMRPGKKDPERLRLFIQRARAAAGEPAF